MSLDVNIYLDHTTPITGRNGNGVVTSHRINLDDDVTVYLADLEAVKNLLRVCKQILLGAA